MFCQAPRQVEHLKQLLILLRLITHLSEIGDAQRVL